MAYSDIEICSIAAAVHIDSLHVAFQAHDALSQQPAFILISAASLSRAA